MTGTELQAIRTRLGLTQEERGDKLGVRKNTVWRWEHGQRGIPESIVKLINFIRKEEKATKGKK